ncbi:hypothetical protein WG628_13515 [Stenotrophomonas maltophilia]
MTRLFPLSQLCRSDSARAVAWKLHVAFWLSQTDVQILPASWVGGSTK